MGDLLASHDYPTRTEAVRAAIQQTMDAQGVSSLKSLQVTFDNSKVTQSTKGITQETVLPAAAFFPVLSRLGSDYMSWLTIDSLQITESLPSLRALDLAIGDVGRDDPAPWLALLNGFAPKLEFVSVVYSVRKKNLLASMVEDDGDRLAAISEMLLQLWSGSTTPVCEFVTTMEKSMWSRLPQELSAGDDRFATLT